jgi:hypothetical protein
MATNENEKQKYIRSYPLSFLRPKVKVGHKDSTSTTDKKNYRSRRLDITAGDKKITAITTIATVA